MRVWRWTDRPVQHFVEILIVDGETVVVGLRFDGSLERDTLRLEDCHRDALGGCATSYTSDLPAWEELT